MIQYATHFSSFEEFCSKLEAYEQVYDLFKVKKDSELSNTSSFTEAMSKNGLIGLLARGQRPELFEFAKVC